MTEGAVAGSVVGIDVGGTSVRVLAEAPDGTRGTVLHADTPTSYDAFVAVVDKLVTEAVAGPVDRVCCGLPGTSRGPVADFVPALPWVHGRAVGTDLSDRLGVPVALGYDGQLTLLAEVREGAARGCASAVLVAVGTGIGGAVMVDGRIWRGHRGTAGAWGWLPACGALDDRDHGGLEQVASGRALSRAATMLSPPTDGPGLVELARRHDRHARVLLDDYAVRLGRGIAAIASVIDPEVVLVGGGLSAAMDLLQPLLEQRVALLASPNGRTVPVVAAALGPYGGVVGAVHAARAESDAWL